MNQSRAAAHLGQGAQADRRGNIPKTRSLYADAGNYRSLHSLGKDLAPQQARLRGLVGPRPPSSDTLGRVYGLADSAGLCQILGRVHYDLKRIKALADGDDLKIAAVDGHEFFKSRKRCCPQCQQRTIQVHGQEVVE